MDIFFSSKTIYIYSLNSAHNLSSQLVIYFYWFYKLIFKIYGTYQMILKIFKYCTTNFIIVLP